MLESLAPWVCVGAGGALGAIARYQLSLWVGVVPGDGGAAAFPLGTLACNALGCLVIGVLMAHADRLPENARLLLVTGLLGALTTFSTFGWETLVLVRERALGLALLNVGANVVLALAAVTVGIWAARGFE